MILLTGHSLTPARKVPVEALSLDLKERDSTANMTPADMTGIGVNSWLRDETNPGAGIVWRVKSISQAYATDTPTVQLEHIVNSLRDNVLFGEITAATITGNPKATTCTAEQAVRFILSYQRDWVLGSFGYNVSNPYKFDGESLFDALETVTNSLTGAWWSYDMSVYPFRLNITAKPDGVASEMRPVRNLKVITRTIDKGGMYTRLYPTGKDDLHITGDYVEKNANIYGVVAKVETDNSIDTEPELRRWATERLANHCEPTVTIDVEGVELADATGEPLDRLQLGRYCRVPLPEFSTTITERVVGLSYPDKVHNPEVVKITLANNRTDVTRILADAIKNGAGGRGGRTAGKQSKEDHAWFEDTDDHVAMCAEALIGRDASGVDWYRLSSIIVDGEGIHQKVEATDGRVTRAYTLIDQNEERIRLEAKRASDAEGELSGRLTVQADKIEAEVRRATNAEGSLSGRITVEAGKINQVVSAVGKDGKVTAASICLAINNGGSTATINADKIYLLGQTIANTISADYISSKIASLATVDMKGATVYGNLYIRNGGGSSQNVSGAIWDLWLDQSGDTYTLKRKRIQDSAWVDVGSFSRATSLSGSWSSGVLTVTASPQGNTYSDAVQGGSESWANGICTIPIQHSTNGGTSWYGVGASAYAHVYKSDISIPTSWSSSSSDPGGDVQVSLNKNYTYHKCTVNVHGTTKTIRVKLIS